MADPDKSSPRKSEMVRLWREVEPHIVHVTAGSALTGAVVMLAMHSLFISNKDVLFFVSAGFAGVLGKLVHSEVGAIRRIISQHDSRRQYPPSPP